MRSSALRAQRSARCGRPVGARGSGDDALPRAQSPGLERCPLRGQEGFGGAQAHKWPRTRVAPAPVRHCWQTSSGTRSGGTRTRLRTGALAVAIALLSVAAVNAAPLAHWSFEKIDSGIVPDASGHGHEAVASGKDSKLPEVVPGIVGNCLKFSAAAEQYLEVKAGEPLQAPAAFTAMAWIKPESRSGTYEIITNKGDKSGEGPWPGWRLRYFWSRAGFQFGAADSTEPTLYSPEWSVPAGFWSHVAVTYDGRRAVLYIDCEPAAEQQLAVPIMPSTKPFIIGNYIGRKNAYAFDGLLDELKVFDTVLTPEQIYEEASRGMAQ